jgi:hypothetical protein
MLSRMVSVLVREANSSVLISLAVLGWFGGLPLTMLLLMIVAAGATMVSDSSFQLTLDHALQNRKPGSPSPG